MNGNDLFGPNASLDQLFPALAGQEPGGQQSNVYPLLFQIERIEDLIRNIRVTYVQHLFPTDADDMPKVLDRSVAPAAVTDAEKLDIDTGKFHRPSIL